MLRLLATLSPGLLMLISGLGAGVPLGAAGYAIGKAVGHHQGFNDGTAKMAVAVEKQNATAAQAAKIARQSLDTCYDAGGRWDQSTGKCFQ